MFYLKKVIAIIENVTYKSGMEMLVKTLQEQGIQCQCFWVDDMGLAQVTVESVLDAVWEATSKEDAVSDAGEVKNGESACLWMTDMSEFVRVLRHEEQPVLALLHENNRGLDFSAALYACEEPQDLDADYMDKVYRRYMRLPWEILRTGRCLIRETTPEDVEAFYEIYREPSVTRYTEGLFPEREQEKQYINDYIDNVYSFYDFGVWTILKEDTGEIIGRAGFSYREGYDEPELGFVIGCPWQRQGFAEEVCRAILEYGRQELGFTAVQAFVRPENKASLALCRKLGMQPAREVEIADEQYLCMKIDFT